MFSICSCWDFRLPASLIIREGGQGVREGKKEKSLYSQPQLTDLLYPPRIFVIRTKGPQDRNYNCFWVFLLKRRVSNSAQVRHLSKLKALTKGAWALGEKLQGMIKDLQKRVVALFGKKKNKNNVLEIVFLSKPEEKLCCKHLSTRGLG